MNAINPPGMPLILIGAGGHAKVLLALLRAAGLTVLGVCDPKLARQQTATWQGIAVLGDDRMLDGIDPSTIGLVHGIGKIVGENLRSQVFDRYKAKGFTFPVLVHPSAWVAPTAEMSEGVQVMAGAIIQPDCRIGENSIINTRASIDHDCHIGKHVHIAPGATLCGEVVLDDHTFVGSGATIIQGLRVGEHALVGAGATVIRDVAPFAKALGIRPYT